MTDTDTVPRWICPNCGQFYFGEDPPDLCDYCQDFTTWQRVPQTPPPGLIVYPRPYRSRDDEPPEQLPLFDD